VQPHARRADRRRDPMPAPVRARLRRHARARPGHPRPLGLRVRRQRHGHDVRAGAVGEHLRPRRGLRTTVHRREPGPRDDAHAAQARRRRQHRREPRAAAHLREAGVSAWRPAT
jgi:hypothetical protein